MKQVDTGIHEPGRTIRKTPTGITGLDEVTNGGLPAGRLTLVTGGPGCGKTILAMEFLLHGILEYDDAGLFVSFEETPAQLAENFLSFGYDVEKLVAEKKLAISHVNVLTEDIVEAGDFTLDALIIRLEYAIKQIGARRLVLDTMETLFGAIGNRERLRIEIARLFHWLRQQGVTTVVTGEAGEKTITRQGFEEYVSDCVLVLDHRVSSQISKRRLRVVKYRGSSHGADEHPFLIKDRGISVLPITSILLKHEAGRDRISSGIKDLDTMLEGKGYYKGSSVLISGKAGTGKSSLAASFADSVCRRKRRCLYLAFEESPEQLVRNMQSIGIDLAPWLEQELLFIRASRPTVFGLEEHLVAIFKLISELRPESLIMDPLSNFITIGTSGEIKSMLVRLLDHIKNLGVTILATNLTAGSRRIDETETAVSSLMDTWITLDNKLVDNVRHRELQIIKSRGMDHSQEARELLMSASGLTLGTLPYFNTDTSITSSIPGKRD